jgi:hypothetical protein
LPRGSPCRNSNADSGPSIRGDAAAKRDVPASDGLVEGSGAVVGSRGKSVDMRLPACAGIGGGRGLGCAASVAPFGEEDVPTEGDAATPVPCGSCDARGATLRLGELRTSTRGSAFRKSSTDTRFVGLSSSPTSADVSAPNSSASAVGLRGVLGPREAPREPDKLWISLLCRIDWRSWAMLTPPDAALDDKLLPDASAGGTDHGCQKLATMCSGPLDSRSWWSASPNTSAAGGDRGTGRAGEPICKA